MKIKKAVDTEIFRADEEAKVPFEDQSAEVTKEGQEVVIFCGSSGSGKSTFWSNYLRSYTRINQDTLKTPAKCKAALIAALERGESAVIDNTNKSIEERGRYISVCKDKEVPVRCFWFKLEKPLVMFLNGLRKTEGFRTHFSRATPPVVVHTFFKNL